MEPNKISRVSLRIYVRSVAQAHAEGLAVFEQFAFEQPFEVDFRTIVAAEPHAPRDECPLDR